MCDVRIGGVSTSSYTEIGRTTRILLSQYMDSINSLEVLCMCDRVNKSIVVETDMLVEYFLKLLQRDGVISNSTYLEATRKLKEGKNVNSN